MSKNCPYVPATLLDNYGNAHCPHLVSPWRPMDEAPRDGINFLVLDKEGMVVEAWYHEKEEIRTQDEVVFMNKCRAWMPIPAVPERFPWEEEK